MIDKKKIEEAAVNYLNKSRLAYHSVYCADVREAFKDGVNWYLNNIWHPGNEVPDDWKILLVQRTNYDYYVAHCKPLSPYFFSSHK